MDGSAEWAVIIGWLVAISVWGTGILLVASYYVFDYMFHIGLLSH